MNLLVATLATVVFTWWVMLFLGNLGVNEMGFLACLPAGLILMEVVKVEVEW